MLIPLPTFLHIPLPTSLYTPLHTILPTPLSISLPTFLSTYFPLPPTTPSCILLTYKSQNTNPFPNLLASYPTYIPAYILAFIIITINCINLLKYHHFKTPPLNLLLLKPLPTTSSNYLPYTTCLTHPNYKPTHHSHYSLTIAYTISFKHYHSDLPAYIPTCI